MNRQWILFISFFRSNLLGFGGGPAVIPLVENEVVKKYKLMDSDDFANTLAIANTLPGPIATKMAGYIGYKYGGWIGCINAILATVLPTVVAVIILVGGLQKFQDYAFVQGMTKGVIIVVAAMMISMMLEFLKKSKAKLGWKIGTVILVLSLLALFVLNIHPGILIAGLLVAAFILPIRKEVE